MSLDGCAKTSPDVRRCRRRGLELQLAQEADSAPASDLPIEGLGKKYPEVGPVRTEANHASDRLWVYRPIVYMPFCRGDDKLVR